MPNSHPLTTGQAAEYCHVSQTTIINWIRDGKLKAYTTPGGHYRIRRSDFLSFLETYNMPVDPTLRSSPEWKLLLISDSPNAADLARALEEDGGFQVSLARNGYEAGAKAVRLEPRAVVIDMDASLDSLGLCRWIRVCPEGDDVSVVALGDPADEKAARAAGADVYLPNDAIASLEAELRGLLRR